MPEEDPVPADPVEKAKHYFNKYTIECGLLFVVIFYIFLFWKGKNRNNEIAIQWAMTFQNLIKTQYAHLGMDEKYSVTVEQISYNEYQFYASGRNNLHYTHFMLDLKKRQDLLSMMLLNFLWPERDQLFIEFALDPRDETLPIELMVIPRKDQKSIYQTLPYLKSMVSPIQTEGFDKNHKHMVLGEDPETIKNLMANQVGSTLSKFSDQLHSLHVTDQRCYNKYPLQMKLSLIVGETQEQHENAAKMFKSVLELADRLGSLKLSDSVKKMADKNRSSMKKQETKEKQEGRLEKLYEKKAIEEQERMARVRQMSPNSQRKYEEKQRQKELKQQKKRLTKMAKF